MSSVNCLTIKFCVNVFLMCLMLKKIKIDVAQWFIFHFWDWFHLHLSLSKNLSFKRATIGQGMMTLLIQIAT